MNAVSKTFALMIAGTIFYEGMAHPGEETHPHEHYPTNAARSPQQSAVSSGAMPIIGLTLDSW